MKRAYSLWAYLKKRPYLSGAAALLLLLGGWMVVGSGNGSELETMVIEPSDFTATISIAGNVIAAQEVDLGFTQSGRVMGVYAKVGERVSAGKLLAHIENGDLQADLQSARARLDAAQEGTRLEELHIAQADVTNAKAALVNSINDAYRAVDDAVRTKTSELFNNPRTNPKLTFITESSSGKRDSESGRSRLEVLLTEWESRIPVSIAQNVESEASYAQRMITEASSFLTAVSAALNFAVADAYSTQTELDAYSAGIATARTNVSAAQSDITSSLSTLNEAEKNLTLSQAGSRPSDIAIEQAAVQAAQAALAKTVITAPFSGIITVMEAEVGEIVSPNTSEISMISEGEFQIESYIPEVIISQVEPGDKATVYLDAYGQSVPFNAVVVSIDPAETVRDGVSTYKTILQFDEESDRIRSGMTANITVTTQEKAQTVVIPQGALIKRGEQSFVEVLVSGDIEERSVTTGLTSLGQIEILSGLRSGDVLVLNPSS